MSDILTEELLDKETVERFNINGASGHDQAERLLIAIISAGQIDQLRFCLTRIRRISDDEVDGRSGAGHITLLS